jgi:hypothetical protein
MPGQVLPRLNELQVQPQGGRIDYDLQILAPGDSGNPPSVHPESVYAPARNVSANTIRVPVGSDRNEDEKFIFYRGLGNFRTDLSIRSSRDNGLRITNRAHLLGRRPGAIFLLEVKEDGGGNVLRLDAHLKGFQRDLESLGTALVPAQVLREVRSSPTVLGRNEFLADAHRQLVAALVESGLYHDEAVAMSRTWERSYFQTPGLRVLYVLAREETDELLPIRISPEPNELVRTLVGRIEVLTAKEEEDLFEQVVKIHRGPESLKLGMISRLGRTAEARLTRLLSRFQSEGGRREAVEEVMKLLP